MDRALPLEEAFAWQHAEQSHRLLRFSDEVLAQGAALAAAFGEHDDRFAARVGPHLRHIVEHYEALVLRSYAGEVDYDSRPRDRTIERSPTLARERIAELRAALREWASTDLDDALLVFTLCGVDGRWPMATASTLSRELVLLASHAVHHYALLREHCEQHGIALPPSFGVAPATRAHARAAH